MTDHILVIEDEPAIADTLVYSLKEQGFDPHWFRLAADGLAHLQSNEVDLVILDIGLPDENGFEVCKKIRAFSQVPIIFLTARREEIDRIVGLEIGADDYVTKPFSPREVCARVKTILRRIRALQKNSTDTQTEPSHNAEDELKGGQKQPTGDANEFVLDSERQCIYFLSQKLDLTRYELLVLSALIDQPERVFSRAQLMEKVWDEPEASFDRAVDTHIKTLRAKLRAISDAHNPIRTHRGLGYSYQPHGQN